MLSCGGACWVVAFVADTVRVSIKININYKSSVFINPGARDAAREAGLRQRRTVGDGRELY